MTFEAILGTLELGTIYAILALGIYIAFRILDMPDLTVDGSFVTGAAVSAIVCLGNHPFLGLPMAFLAGCITGCITSILHTKLRIQMLLAGILSMLALYSINLRIMGGKPNISLLNKTTIFTYFEDSILMDYTKIVIILVILIIVLLTLYLFLNTRIGFALRATGNNEFMARAQGINTDFAKLLGLGLANGLVALSGAVLAQYQLFTDVSMGIGMIVIGLASIMTGEVFSRGSFKLLTLCAVVFGSVLYRFIITAALHMGMPPTDLKLISATIVALALSVPAIKSNFGRAKSRLLIGFMKRRKHI
jgi:putative ABC transport system permease protein